MNRSFKRTMAFVLAVCMLLPMVPLGVIAEDTYDADTKTQVYDLKQYNFGSSFDSDDVVKLNGANGYYTNGDIEWTYIADKGDGGIRSYTASDSRLRQFRMASAAGGEWIAYKINAPKAGEGTYQVSLNNHPRSEYGASSVNVYVFPGNIASLPQTAADAANITAIDSAIAAATASNKVGTVDFNGGSTAGTTGDSTEYDSVIGEYPFAASSDGYIVVFEAAQPSITRDNGYYMFMTDLELTYVGPLDSGTGEEEPLYSETYDFYYGTANGNVVNKVADIAADYTAEPPVLNWNYVGTNNATDSNLRYRSATQSIQARNFAIRNDEAGTIGDYVAFKLRLPTEAVDSYTISMNHPVSNYGGVANVYILDSTVTDIPAALASATAAGTIDFMQGTESNDTTGTAEFVTSQISENVSFGEATEVIIVFEAAAFASNRTSFYMHLAELVLTEHREEIPVNLETMEYDFRFSGITADKTKVFSADGKSAIDPLYDAGTMTWTPYAQSMAEGSYAQFRTEESTSYIPGIQTYTYLGDWLAIKIKSPGTGTYTVTLDHGTHAGGSKEGTVYVLPGDTEATVAAIDALLGDSTKVGTVDFKTGNRDVANPDVTVVGEVPCTEGEEYILVFKPTQDKSGNTTNEGDTPVGAQMYLQKLDLTRKAEDDSDQGGGTGSEGGGTGSEGGDTGDEGGENTPVADTFPKTYDLFYTGSFNLSAKEAAIAADYAADVIDWAYAGTSNAEASNVRFRADNQSIQVRKFALGDYVAFKLRAPVGNNGPFTISMKHPVSNYGGVANVYILDAATTDIAAAIAASDALGTIDFMQGTDSNATIGTNEYVTSKIVGDYTFGGAEEYLIVFEAAQAPAVENRPSVYMHLAELVVSVGDLPADEGTGNEGEGEGEGDNDQDVVIPNVDVNVMEYDFRAEVITKDKTKFIGAGSDLINPLYAAGSINWRPFAEGMGEKSYAQFRTQESTSYIPGIQSYTYLGDWFAVKIASPGNGTYAVTLDYGTHSGGAKEGTMYVLPGDVASADAISAMLGDSTKVGTVDFKTGNRDVNHADVTCVGEMTCEAGKEYILVFKVTADKLNNTTPTNDANGNPIGGQMYLQKLTLAKKSYTDGTYDFGLDAYNGKTLTDTVGGTTVHKEIQTMFAVNSLNWMVEGLTANGTKFSADSLNYTSPVDGWIAFRVTLPGSGVYAMTMKHPVSTSGAKNVNVYVAPADAASMENSAIEALMTEENLLGDISFNGTTGTAQSDIGTWFSTSGVTEYLLIFEATEAGSKNAEMYLGQLSIAARNNVVYDFDLADKANGLDGYHSKTIAEKLEELKKLYSDGTINWQYYDALNTREKYAEDPASGIIFRRASGMRVTCNSDDWAAFLIDSPGTGTYTLSLNYALYGYGTEECSVYILPVPKSGTDMESYIKTVIEDQDAVGSVNMCELGAAETDGQRAVLGSFDFAPDQQYMVVFAATLPATGYAAGSASYMHFSQLSATEGVIETTTTKTVRPVELGEMVKEVSMRSHIASYEVNGQDYYFLPIEGGTLLVYNLDTKQKVDEVETGIDNAWGVCASPNGMVYICGDDKFVYKYDPFKGVGEKLPYYSDSYRVGYGIIATEDEVLYFGTRHSEDGAAVYRYDPDSRTYTVFGDLDTINGIATTCNSVAVGDGYIYASIYGNVTSASGKVTVTKAIVKIDEATGKVVACKDVSDRLAPLDPEKNSEVTTIGFMSYVDGVLFPGQYTLSQSLYIDTETMEYIDIGCASACGGYVSEERDGKIYYVTVGQGVWEYDIATRTASPVMGLGSVAVVLRTNINSFVTVNHSDLPGESLFTASTSSAGGPVFYNLETKKSVNWTDFTAGEGSWHNIRSVTASDDGTNRIFVGAYTTAHCAIYDADDESVMPFVTTGQTDSLITYKGKVYAGCYSAGQLVEVNPNTGSMRNILKLTADPTDYAQKRIHTICAGDDKVFIGTVPDSYLLGGCLAWYDLNTRQYHVEENIVKDQIIITMFYHDGLLFCGTSTSGGTSATPTQKEAYIMVYDVAKKQKVGQYSVKLDGIEEPPFISGLAVDENGKYWGRVSDTLFSFTFNKSTKTMTFKEELSFSKTNYNLGGNSDWFERPILFHDGYVYVCFASSYGGFRKINMADPSDNVRLMVGTPTKYAIGEDGNLYYGKGDMLMMYPLNPTEADWAAAAKVDTLIAALDTNVTMKNKSAVEAATAAYNKLTNVQKGLVQNISALNTAQRRRVKVLITALPANITLDHKSQVTAAREAYDALTTIQKNRVSNYDILVAAEQTIRALEYEIACQEAAAKVDALIDAIPADVNLETKSFVVAARKAYDSLTDYQKTLVKNYDKLLAAEAIITELERQENQAIADRVAAMIDAIGEVTLDDASAISMARMAYAALTDEQKAMVRNYDVLVAAEARLKELQADKQVAKGVEALIDLIGTVTKDSGPAIAAAREAYEALTESQKALVDNYDVLLAAEEAFANLGKLPVWAIILITVGAAIGAGAVTVFCVPALRTKALALLAKLKKKDKAVKDEAAEDEAVSEQ